MSFEILPNLQVVLLTIAALVVLLSATVLAVPAVAGLRRTWSQRRVTSARTAHRGRLALHH